MTTAPANLLAARRLLIDTLNIDEDTVRDSDLEPGEVGIVGNAAHRGGYHCGSDRVVTNDYSVVESTRDKAGLTLYASALDVGMFEVRVAGKVHNLVSFSIWCVAQCKANAPDTRDIREIIYSPDGRTVRRFDRLGKRSSGDDSHLYHTHFSYFRDATRGGWDQTPLFRRYLTIIGLLEDDDMTPEEHNWLQTVHRNLTVLDGRNPIGQIYTRMALGEDHTDPAFKVQHPTLKSLATKIAEAEAKELARDAEAAARDAAQTKLIETVLAASGKPMTPEQFEAALTAMREAAAEAGAAATARLSAQLAAAAQAEADALATPAVAS